ncbi:hypothetical protein VNO80_18548 [Phaseolus coccineus]|uniref:Uncharacterized protein n=1 Tax=Phaseolus coccineus TaxID=3886 RepID=A0AAN9MHX8_PHACN
MDGVENMDGEFEQTTLDMFIDWNHDTFQPTFLHSDTSHTAFQNFVETITELAAVTTPVVAGSVVEITDPISLSYEGSSRAAALTFVPNPLPQLPPNSSLLNATQLNHPLSAEGLMLEGRSITQTGYFNQLLDLQNGNLLAYMQGLGIVKGHTPVDNLPHPKDLRYFRSTMIQKVSTETAKGGTSVTSQGAQRTPDSVVNTDPNALLPNPLSAPRQFENAIYDIEFERKGQLLGPHLTLFKPPPEN